MKLLRERYKTRDGAMRRCGFENAMAKGEYDRGDKARLYVYRVVPDPTVPDVWRVQRESMREQRP